VLHLSGFSMPSLELYMMFALYFCLAKFSTAAVPGGGVIVLLPVLQSHMGLTPEMASLVATIYILQDSIFTASNVMGNGAFAILSHHFVKRFGLLKEL
jgi:Na+/H+-dicarboxylate symporter